MLNLDAAATHDQLPMAPLIDALRAMAVEGCVLPPRQVLTVAEGEAPGSLLAMAAWQPGRYLGFKTVTVFAANAARGLPSLHAIYTLFDAATGVPLAQFDGAALTSRRTAAVSALAASFLARSDAADLLVVGCGRVASLVPQAMAAVRPIERVQVWNHRAEGARTLAHDLCAQGFCAEATEDLRGAVQRAQIVSCATLATQPLIQGDWLQPGAHLDLIGSFAPEMREADARCVARARVFIDQDEALAKAGDLLQAMTEHAFERTQLQGTLEQLCRGQCSGRAGTSEITLFKSVGSAWQDLAAAGLVMGRAR
ncbi:MAG TPA: ornithine cyclodeaminase family protein [Burkholderiaceae bacterium]|nr:ornithine cyclodeaminase family protein [Burkholderiaceae bacterium]